MRYEPTVADEVRRHLIEYARTGVTFTSRQIANELHTEIDATASILTNLDRRWGLILVVERHGRVKFYRTAPNYEKDMRTFDRKKPEWHTRVVQKKASQPWTLTEPVSAVTELQPPPPGMRESHFQMAREALLNKRCIFPDVLLDAAVRMEREGVTRKALFELLERVVDELKDDGANK